MILSPIITRPSKSKKADIRKRYLPGFFRKMINYHTLLQVVVNVFGLAD